MYKSEPGMWKIYREIRDINEEEEQALKNGGRRPPRKAEQGRTPNRTASMPSTTHLLVLFHVFPGVRSFSVQSVYHRLGHMGSCAAEHARVVEN